MPNDVNYEGQARKRTAKAVPEGMVQTWMEKGSAATDDLDLIGRYELLFGDDFQILEETRRKVLVQYPKAKADAMNRQAEKEAAERLLPRNNKEKGMLSTIQEQRPMTLAEAAAIA